MRDRKLEHSSSQSSGDDPSAADHKNGDNHGATVVGRPRLFSGILPADYAGICPAAHDNQFARGEMLHFEGDAVARVLLTSGLVKTTKFSQGGEEVIRRLAIPPDVLGAVGLFSSGTHCNTAQVFRACPALVWDARAFKGIVEHLPVLHQNNGCDARRALAGARRPVSRGGDRQSWPARRAATLAITENDRPAGQRRVKSTFRAKSWHR